MFLNRHVVAGQLTYPQLASLEVKPERGDALTKKVEGASLTLDGALVEGTEIPATNGVIFAVSALIDDGSKAQ